MDQHVDQCVHKDRGCESACESAGHHLMDLDLTEDVSQPMDLDFRIDLINSNKCRSASSAFLTFFVSKSISLSACLGLFFSVTVCLSVSLSLSLSVSLSLSLSLCLSSLSSNYIFSPNESELRLSLSLSLSLT